MSLVGKIEEQEGKETAAFSIPVRGEGMGEENMGTIWGGLQRKFKVAQFPQKGRAQNRECGIRLKTNKKNRRKERPNEIAQ